MVLHPDSAVAEAGGATVALAPGPCFRGPASGGTSSASLHVRESLSQLTRIGLPEPVPPKDHFNHPQYTSYTATSPPMK